ncbi:MAG: hypothetical protein ACK53L_13625, partial [Pirellulaceae bacterium]
GTSWQSIAVSGGFAEVDANEVTVFVHTAERGSRIDAAAAEKELDAAQQPAAAFDRQPTSTMLQPAVVGDEHYRTARLVQSTLQRYKELQDIIAILGLDELSEDDRRT